MEKRQHRKSGALATDPYIAGERLADGRCAFCAPAHATARRERLRIHARRLTLDWRTLHRARYDARMSHRSRTLR